MALASAAHVASLGQLTEFTTFSIEMDFAFPGRPSFMDVWGEQANLPIVGHARIGQYRQPVTMDSWTNVKHLEFLERSAPFIAMDPFRRVGILGWDNSDDERTMWAYSLFGTGLTFWNGGPNQIYNTEGNDNRFGTQLGDSGGISFATRTTHLLYYDPHANNRYLLHVGGGYLFGELGGDRNHRHQCQGVRSPHDSGILRRRPSRRLPDGSRYAERRRYRSLSGHELSDAARGACRQLGPGPFPGRIHGHLRPAARRRNGLSRRRLPAGRLFSHRRKHRLQQADGGLDYNVIPHTRFFGIGRKKRICGWGAGKWPRAGHGST